MPMIDPATMTRTEICNVTTTPCRRSGSSWITVSNGAPPSDRPPNAPLQVAEQSGDGVRGGEVENSRGRPCLDVLEGIGDNFASDERQLRYGNGHGQRGVLEKGDERVAERRQDSPKHDRQCDVADGLPRTQSQGATCLDEAAADTEDAGAEHFREIR